MGFEAWFIAAGGAALFCAVAAWLSGLPLRRAAADPTLAERFNRHRIRLFLVVVAAVVPIVVAASGEGARTGPWLVPLTVGLLFVAGMGAMAGGYPLRRDLSGEANPLPTYVVRGARGVLAMYGLGLSVLMLPYLVHAVPLAAPVAA